jgi:hypothetical protein
LSQESFPAFDTCNGPTLDFASDEVFMKRSLLLSLALVALPAISQTPGATLHTAAEVAQHESKLMATAAAAPNGFASEALDEFGSARTLLVVRVHTGPAECHQQWADQMVVNTGTITLVYGGTMQGIRPNGTAAGETLGDSITGGTEITLHAGDIAHIPAGIPHWVKLAPGTTTSYIVFKEK